MKYRLFVVKVFLFAIFSLTIFCFVEKSWAYPSKILIPLSNGKYLPTYLFLPRTPYNGSLPTVIEAVGVGSQIFMQYQTHCQYLADRGFAVLLLDPSNHPENLSSGPINWDRGIGYIKGSINQVVVGTKLYFDTKWYLNSLKAAVDFLYFSGNFDSSRIAISGHSQPANAALSYACKDPRVKAIVWNYGGHPWIMPYDPFRLPPVLIFHGEKDDVYDVKYARELISNLRMTCRNYEFYIYPNQKHMFRVYFDPRKETRLNRPALLDSFERQVAFLKKVLQIPH